MAIADKLAYLQESKNQIKNAIINKGINVTNEDPFRSYADKIQQIKETGETTRNWQPEADWFDIEKILEEDTQNYAMKIICLLTDELDDKAVTNTVKGGEKYKLSDGQIIEQSTSLDITNLFDISKDKVCSKGYKTRYIIYYSNASTMNITLPNNVIYTIFSGVKFNSSPFSDRRFLQSIKFINNCKFTNTSMHYFLLNCSSLQQISELDTSNVTDMSSMFSGCCSLQQIPSIDTRNVTDMSGMFSGCYCLQQIASIDTSNVTNMNTMFFNCYNLRQIFDLNMGNIASANNTFSGTFSVFQIKNITQINSSISFSALSKLNHKTLLRILNALVDLTDTSSLKLTLGNTNLAKLTEEEKAIAINKNWTLA